jgi:hypothetical protein
MQIAAISILLQYIKSILLPKRINNLNNMRMLKHFQLSIKTWFLNSRHICYLLQRINVLVTYLACTLYTEPKEPLPMGHRTLKSRIELYSTRFCSILILIYSIYSNYNFSLNLKFISIEKYYFKYTIT